MFSLSRNLAVSFKNLFAGVIERAILYILAPSTGTTHSFSLIKLYVWDYISIYGILFLEKYPHFFFVSDETVSTGCTPAKPKRTVIRKMSKHRNWVITVNNYSDAQLNELKQWCEKGTQVTYAVLGKETGEANETPHIQGYLELAGARTLHWLKKQPGLGTCHAESRKGDALSAISYCQKDGDWWETGSPKNRRGQRTDLIEVQKHLDNGESIKWISRHYFVAWCQYGRRFREYASLQRDVPRKWKSWTNVIVGRTGIGKTRIIYHLHADDDIWRYPGKGWFDGYEGQPIALFDDFRGDMDISLLLQVLDRYPMDVPVKGGHQNWCPRKIYITSNQLPEMWYELIDSKTHEALNRRMDRRDIIDENEFIF